MAVTETLSKTKSNDKISPRLSGLETTLSSWFAPIAVTAFFLLVLAIWSACDHSLPVHDAAWHSTFSNTIKQWLCRPRGWSWESLNAILTMQPNYPTGTWFFNGFCKIFLGDSLWSEHAILAIHLCILNASTWMLANLLLKDRFKATLTIIFLDCCPLILALQHLSYIDLPQTAFLGAYLFSLAFWWQRRSWKSALVCGLLFGLDCTTKQIAVLYSVPSLALLALILAYRREYKGLAQAALIGFCGAAFLASWVIPNLKELTEYTHNRHNFATARIGVIPGICRSMTAAAPMIFQSFSPLMAILLVLSVFKIKKSDLKSAWLAIFAPSAGALLLVTATYFAFPETRYFGPLMITLSLLLALGAANLCRENRKGSFIVLASLFACSAQTLLLCFQTAPVVSHPQVKNLSPVFACFGLNEPSLTSKIPFCAAGDPWKQEWMFRLIEDTEKHSRPVYLNVMENSPEYNQGTLLCFSRLRHSCVCPTTWRGNYNMPDVSDSFVAGDKELHFMQWVCLKTGTEQYVPWFDQRSKRNYEEVVRKLQHNGLFIEAGRQKLPDGTELVLYQNKFWKFDHTVPAFAPGAQLGAGTLSPERKGKDI